MCVCVRPCVHVCVRVCVRARIHVCVCVREREGVCVDGVSECLDVYACMCLYFSVVTSEYHACVTECVGAFGCCRLSVPCPLLV